MYWIAWCLQPFAVLLLCGGVAAAEPFEQPPVFRASEILREVPETLAGEHFRVREMVQNDGYWDFYTIDTPFGVFTAHGWLDLRNTIREINAIAYLETLSRTQVFAEAALEKGLEPVDLASQIIQHPVQTARNIPGGIVEMFQRFARRARELMEWVGRVGAWQDTSEEDPRLEAACQRGEEPFPEACDKEGYADDFGRLVRHYFDVDDTSREYHETLGTDPYSTNEVLQNAITRIAWFGSIGDFGMRKLSPYRKIKTVATVAEVYRLTWTKDPFELRKYLDEVLAGIGIPKERREYFLNNPFLTPSKQTSIVLSLQALESVGGREHLLDWVADSRNEDEALYSVETGALIAWYHGAHGVRRFLPTQLMPVFETPGGGLVSMHPIDHLSWTEEVATILEAVSVTGTLPTDRPRVLWLLNRASDRARREIESRGYVLVEDGYREVLESGLMLNIDPLPSNPQDPAVPGD